MPIKLQRHLFNPSYQHMHSTQQIYHPMNLNELTFHKANPFYKQDFIPDRAWFNRKAKEYPSEMPSGKDYFVDNGRKHFTNRFNHSEIQNENLLKSPQRYPFENRIAMDKTYMRSLHTIDIEGASSNTRVNQSIKNKLKAQEELARRYNQSVDMEKPKEKTQQEKRRQVAMRQFQEYQERKLNRQKSNSQTIDSSRVQTKGNNPETLQDISLKNQLSEEYKRFVMQSSNNKWNKNIPQPRIQERSDSSQKYQEQAPNYQSIDTNLRRYYSSNTQQSPKRESQRQNIQNQQRRQNSYQVQQSQLISNQNGAQPAPTPSSHYQYQFKGQKLKINQDNQRLLKYQQMTRQVFQNPRDLRKNNPTNLSISFNLAGQSIVSS